MALSNLEKNAVHEVWFKLLNLRTAMGSPGTRPDDTGIIKVIRECEHWLCCIEGYTESKTAKTSE